MNVKQQNKKIKPYVTADTLADWEKQYKEINKKACARPMTRLKYLAEKINFRFKTHGK